MNPSRYSETTRAIRFGQATLLGIQFHWAWAVAEDTGMRHSKRWFYTRAGDTTQMGWFETKDEAVEAALAWLDV